MQNAFLSWVKYKYPEANVKGIEIVEKVAEFPSKYTNMDHANIEKYKFKTGEMYDYILFGDVLEHLYDPYELVGRLKDQLKPGGSIIASIPNLMNANVIYELLHGDFEYQDSGVLDRTHLRFFTKKEIIRLFSERGYKIEKLIGVSYPLTSTMMHREFFDSLCAIDGVADRSEFDTTQYLVNARKI